MKIKTVFLLLMALLLGLAACSPAAVSDSNGPTGAVETAVPTVPPVPTAPPVPTETAPPPTAEPVALTEEILRNMTYSGIYDEPLTLAEGLYEGEPFVAGGASRPTVTMLPFTAIGDLNGDGFEDAAVLLVEHSGGSGSFFYLAVVTNAAGTMTNTTTTILGDRVSPESIAIEEGNIVVVTAAHAEDDPMCCPSLKVRTRYALQNGALIAINTEDPSEPGDVAGTTVPDTLLGQWQWLAYQDMAELNDITVSDPGKYTLEFLADGTAQIKADCNQASNGVMIDGSSLTFLPGPTTIAECEPGSLYADFLANLSHVVSYVFNADGQLVLNLKMDAGNMIFAPAGEAGDELAGTSWILSGILADGVAETSEIDVEITAVFQDGQMSGYAGCNNYFTGYETDGETLTLGPVGSTMMACDEARGQREIEFLTALETVAGYHIEGGTLALVAADGNTRMMFSAAAETAVPAELAGTWYWLAFQDMADGPEGNDIVVFDPTKYTLEFLADGTVTIQADCNSASNGMTLEGGSLTFLPGPMTLVECAPGSLYDEFLARLGEVVSYVFDDAGNLVLNLQMDGGNLIFSREATLSAGFQDKTWQWMSGPAQPGSSEIITIDNPESYQVTYRSDGTMEIVADCNRATMSYELRQGGLNGSILAAPGPMTLAECEPGSHYLAFINSLEAAQGFQVSPDGDQLQLTLPAGGGTLLLVVAP